MKASHHSFAYFWSSFYSSDNSNLLVSVGY